MNKLFGVKYSNKSKFIFLRDLLLFFIFYSIIGWIYEELLFIIEDNVLCNRGVLFGPWLPIYGFGGLVIVGIFYRFKEKKVKIGKINIRPILLFIESVVFATLMELFATYIIDFTGGNFKNLWDYSDRLLNFQGRIALIPDLKFGIVALIGIYLIQPFLIKFVTMKDQKKVNIVFIILSVLFFADVIARYWLGPNFKG